MQRPQSVKANSVRTPKLPELPKDGPRPVPHIASNGVPAAIKGHLFVNTSIRKPCQHVPELDQALPPSMEEGPLAQLLEQQMSRQLQLGEPS